MRELRGIRLFLGRLLLVAAVLAVWEAVVRLKWIDAFFASRPSTIFTSFYSGLVSGELFVHAGVTAVEMIVGWALGGALGIATGFLLGKFEWLNALVDPIMYALNGLPRVALAPLFILWFGIGFGSKVAISTSIVYFVCVFATYGGIRSVDPGLVQAVRVLGASELQLNRKVVLPSCLPWIFSGLKVSVGMALIGAIVGEFIGARSGVGYYISHSAALFDTAGVFVGIFLLMGMAVALNEIIKAAEHRLLKWRPPIAET
jgi:NitT/TauT family transport system permease protein